MKDSSNSKKNNGRETVRYTILFYLLLMAILLYFLFSQDAGAPAFIYNNF